MLPRYLPSVDEFNAGLGKGTRNDNGRAEVRASAGLRPHSKTRSSLQAAAAHAQSGAGLLREIHVPAFANITTDTPRAAASASMFWYECGRLPGKASTSPVPTS